MPDAGDLNFWYWKENGVPVSLGLDSNMLDACVEEANRAGIKRIHGCPGLGFTGTDLDFLARMPLLERVWLYDVDLQNIDGLYELPHLKYLGVHPKRPPIDFGRLPALDQLYWQWSETDSVEASRTLKQLDIADFKPKSKSFAALRLPEGLERLGLVQANPASFEGLRPMPRLKELSLEYCRKLRTLDGLARIAPKLESITIASCAKDLDRSELQKMPSVEVFDD